MGLVLLGEFQRDIIALQSALGTQDLTSHEGVQKALQLQGEIRGLNRAIDRLFDIAEGTE